MWKCTHLSRWIGGAASNKKIEEEKLNKIKSLHDKNETLLSLLVEETKFLNDDKFYLKLEWIN